VFLPDSLPPQRVLELGRREGIGFTVHLPEELDLAAFEPRMREGDIRCVAGAIAWAAQAGVKRLTMHLSAGVYFTLPDRRVWLYDKHRDVFLANLVDAMRQLRESLSRTGAELLLENTGRFDLPFMQDALDAVLPAFAPHVGLTWDLGHDMAAGLADRPTVGRHLQHVRHLHLHDSDGRSAHQPLFTGRVDIPAALELARSRNLWVVVEVKTAAALERSIRALREQPR
jgi:sugar phosphate isomerase/epimerase